MLIWSKEAFISALSLSLEHSLWQGALVGAVPLALHSRLKRASADVRYAACGLLLLTLVIAWLCSLVCIYAAETGTTTLPVATEQFSTLSTMPVMASGSLSSDPQPRTPRLFTPSLVLLWTLGVSLFSLRHLFSLLALRRLRRVGATPCPPEWQGRIKSLAVRMGLHREVLVRLSTRVDVPLTFGVLKSYILLPPSALIGLRTEQLEALIVHELAHIRLHDSLVNMLQIFAETILFYHPTVWWLSAQMRVDREQRCDDLAVRIVGDHALYARALLTMEELRAPIPHLALRATGGNSHMSNNHLLQRIQRVLGVHGPEKRAPWMAGTLALCTAAIGLATLWPVGAHSAPTPRTPYPSEANQTDGKQVGTISSAPHPFETKQADGQQDATTSSALHPAEAKQKDGQPAMPLPRTSNPPEAKRTDGQQTGKDSPITISTRVNGKAITLTIDSKGLTPETPITVEGQQKRFGDMSAGEQAVIRAVVSNIRKAEATTEWQMGIGTSVNGKSIGLKISSKMPDLTPESSITVEGQQKRFGDLSDEEQAIISAIVAEARKNAHPTDAPHPAEAKQSVPTDWSFTISTSLNDKPITLTIDSKDFTPETLIILDGQQKRFGDMSADEQNQIRTMVASTREADWHIPLSTSVNGKVIGLTIDSHMPDLTPETLITVEGQQKRFRELTPDEQSQISAIWAAARKHIPVPRALHPVEAKQTIVKQTTTTGTPIGIGTRVNGKSIGLTIDSKDFTPETPITVEGQQKRFGDLSADEQNQIRTIVAILRQLPEYKPATPVSPHQ